MNYLCILADNTAGRILRHASDAGYEITHIDKTTRAGRELSFFSFGFSSQRVLDMFTFLSKNTLTVFSKTSGQKWLIC